MLLLADNIITERQKHSVSSGQYYCRNAMSVVVSVFGFVVPKTQWLDTVRGGRVDNIEGIIAS